MIKRINPTEQAANEAPRPDEPSLPPELQRKPIAPKHSDLITQEELRFYLTLIDASRQCIELRNRLVARLEGGAPVEPGDLKPFMITDRQRICSWKRLRRALDRDDFRRIRRRVRKTKYRHLRIKDSHGNIRGWDENRRSDRAGP